MPLDVSFVQLNRAATERLRRLVNGLSDEQLQTRLGEHWTIAICLAHMAFWDRRVMYVLDLTGKEGKVVSPDIDVFVNDLSLPLWAAIPAREAARLAVEWADACDKALEAFPESLLQQVYDNRKRNVVRALHRNEHLDEIDLALKAAGVGH
jgi:uncharacterized damage-inducible protein DinB